MIKFRAWDKETKTMNGMAEIYRNRNQEIELHPRDENIILMQTTGLFDKNGKEIFEGDILKSNKYITSVFYERGAYCVKFRRTPNTTVTMNVISFIEKYKTKIVGNIYENPELLEDCK